MDEEECKKTEAAFVRLIAECKKTEAAFVRLIASLNAVRLMAFGGRGRRDCWAAAVGVSDTVERSEWWSSEDLAGAVAC